MIVIRTQPIEVYFIDGKTGVGGKEWVNAAWQCRCDSNFPLIGRCLPASALPLTVCKNCGRTYIVTVGEDKMPLSVREVPAEP